LINQNLHKQPTALDSAKHRQLKLQVPVTDWSVADRLNAIFVAAAEFGEACREFPIVFVRAGKEPDGSDQIAPIAVLGLTQNQNLFLDGSRWRAQYMPAVLRHYPFCIARVDDKRFAICVDMAYTGAGNENGAPLFEDDGQPAALLKTMQPQMESLETEVQRTRFVGKRLLELNVLRDMRFDATLPDGSKHSVDGFLTVDEKKMAELPEEVVVELHRNGLLGLVHLHWVSLGNMRRLAQWHAERAVATAAPAVTAPA
jgi:hypothetical protein